MSEILRTKADVYKLSTPDLTKKMSTPEGLAEINRALAATDENPVVTAEETAAKVKQQIKQQLNCSASSASNRRGTSGRRSRSESQPQQ